MGWTTATLLGLVWLLSTEAPWKPLEERIVIRDDRPDSLYLALGSQFPAVAQVGRAGDGTLVADRWILTAGHVAASVNPERPEVRIGGRTYGIRRTFVHPQWRELGPHDIGLVELTEPVTGVTPMPLYEGRDEVGQLAILVGHGDTRTGRGGPWVSDGRVRGAMSQVIGIDQGRLVFRFDAPPAGADLGGAPGRGDSGGPALLRRGTSAFVAGISSAGFDGVNGPGTYGAVDHFTRVSDYVAWIRGTIGATH